MHSRHILALLVASVAAAPMGRAGNNNALELEERGIVSLNPDDTTNEKRDWRSPGTFASLGPDGTTAEKRGIVSVVDDAPNEKRAAWGGGGLFDSLKPDDTGVEKRGFASVADDTPAEKRRIMSLRPDWSDDA